jgi:methylated-DNA-[protein]-cysteine S-methyltransferase
MLMTFKDSVHKIVSNIPKGKVMTYKEVAEKAGFPNASRAVGSLMSKNFDLSIPCHRVIRSDGKIGNYNRGGSEKKREILLQEGVILKV